ncbi:hypothetical protein [Microcoleus sp. S13_C5]|uniref:hypothetical protein n=1 Tax=Microcoleus sp. S13_C5 TaxID=3055411 RepID=UPI002FD73677
MSYQKTGMRSKKFSKNTKISQAFNIQPAFTKKTYVAEIKPVEQSLLKHFGHIKDQAASHLCHK